MKTFILAALSVITTLLFTYEIAHAAKPDPTICPCYSGMIEAAASQSCTYNHTYQVNRFPQ